MKPRPSDLSKEERQAMLDLGGTSSDALISTDVIKSLVKRGLLYYRATNHIDMTDAGEEMYEALRASNKGEPDGD